jgi:ABC-2 type transport system permease protein
VSVLAEHDVQYLPLWRLVAAEMLRTWTIPLVSIFMVGTLALAVLGIAASISVIEDAGLSFASDEATRNALEPAGAAWVFTLALGVLGMAGEHRHHTASATFLAEPRRERVFTAKIAAYGLIGLLLGLITEVNAAGIAWLWIAAKGVHLALTGEVWRVLGGALIATVLYGILGVGIGGLLRSQVAAFATVLGWTFLIEPVLGSLWPEAARYLPNSAASALRRVPGNDGLSMEMGGLLFACYVALFVLLGLYAIRRRDITD